MPGVDKFGLTMLPAQAMNGGSLTVLLIHLELITVSTLKMLELGAQPQVVSMLVTICSVGIANYCLLLIIIITKGLATIIISL